MKESVYLLCLEEQKVRDSRKRANSVTSHMDERLTQGALKEWLKSLEGTVLCYEFKANKM